MKAVVFEEHGDAKVLKMSEMADPVPTGSQVAVQLKASSINHIDIWVRKGIPAYPVALPHILGADGAGVISSMGPEAEGVSVGDRVVIIPALPDRNKDCSYCKNGTDNQCENFEILGAKRHGTYADTVVVPDENVMTIPDDLSFEDAAAFPLAHLTAWHMVMGRAQLQSKENILVVGGSSGVGLASIQIAKWRGADVYATTSNKSKMEKLKEAGADDVFITGQDKGVDRWIHSKTDGKGVNVVVEHVGPVTWTNSVKSLARYGRLVTCGATTGPNVDIDLRFLFSRDLSVLGARMGTQKEFQALANAVFLKRIKPIIDKSFPLKDAAAAHTYIEERKHIGKVLLKN